MSDDWPEGWTRDRRGRRRDPDETQVVGAPGDQGAQNGDPTRVLGRPTGGSYANPGSPVAGTAARPTEPGPRRGDHAPPPFLPRTRRRRRLRPVRVLRWALVVLLLVVVVTGGLVYRALSQVDKVDALQDYSGRPAATPGTTWLLVGSDSRGGLSDAERRRLHTGNTAGQRTDTIILLHKPSGGGAPTLVSLPRDSYVPIPGHGRNKLNAAYAFGGPALLVRTIEQVTGIRIDHYAEIGFGGFVGVTDSVGGVRLCPTRNIVDEKSGLNVRKGCQVMNGATALAYVRARYFDPKGDLGRVQRQQEFLSAIFHEATSPSVLLNPFRIVSLADASTKALAIDRRDGPLELIRLAITMHSLSGGGGRSVTVPVADPAYRTPAGIAVKWDTAKAKALFNSLR